MKTRTDDATEFGAPTSRLLGVLTALFSFILVSVSAAVFLYVDSPLPLRAAFGSLPVILLGLTWLFSVRGYTVTGNALLIRRPWWDTAIPLDDLKSVHGDPNAMRGSIRLFGNGGIFAFTGLFWNRALGRYRAWVTDTTKCVVLKFPGRTVLISPDDPQRFEATVSRPPF